MNIYSLIRMATYAMASPSRQKRSILLLGIALIVVIGVFENAEAQESCQSGIGSYHSDPPQSGCGWSRNFVFRGDGYNQICITYQQSTNGTTCPAGPGEHYFVGRGVQNEAGTITCRYEVQLDSPCSEGVLQIDGTCLITPEPGCTCDGPGEDGLPLEAGEAIGYNSCDRPNLTQCSDGSVVEDATTCPVAELPDECDSFDSCLDNECGNASACPSGQYIETFVHSVGNTYGYGCSASGNMCGDNPAAAGNVDAPPNPCTGDYYTNPETGLITCGTFTTDHSNGVTTTTTTQQNGNTISETTDPEGNKSTTTTYPDGSSTTIITNNAGNVTNTTYNITGGGGSSVSGTGSGSGSGGLPSVSEGQEPVNTVSGGLSCDSAPVCTGDEAQCAVLYQTWRIRCPETVDTASLLDQAGLGTAEYSSDKLFREGTNLADTVFDAVGFLPESSSCPAGYTFNAMGESYEIPLTHLCELAEILGYLILALSYFVAGRIVVAAF